MITDFCVMCGASKPDERHHLVPKVYGGDDSYTNLISLCSPCHSSLHGFGIRRGKFRDLQAAGILIAKANGVYKGRKQEITEDVILDIKNRIAAGEPKTRIAKDLKISRGTVYRYSG